ncbi:ankyrin repeat domain-containing protein [Paraglaciecola aquimarina]|uniref:Ankyrin repeat domain-containing protein n=1 Tax=Paraglaciecola algarum TaxID=3050085 RepID=A0ABS9D4Y3_9ALTE|nr:ankyrin repeat domain-containing protein [Paraglaciecola sp. G1-23]MCF2947830.1 ankyrin repeat domain-containing protein [Paraglaciecola sp. G1-23]
MSKNHVKNWLQVACAILLCTTWPTVAEPINPQNVNQQTNDGSTALLRATVANDINKVKQLLSQGAEANINNRYAISPLYVAALNGNAHIAKLLIDAGANTSHKIAGNETILMRAARTGHGDLVKLLIDQQVDIHLVDSRNQNALMWAAAEGHLEVVNILITAGADINAKAQGEFHALAFAARQGHMAVVKAIVEAGFDVNTPMYHDRRGRRFAKSGSSALILAIENGHFELAEYLLTKGADASDLRSGFSPLHTMVEVRKPDIGDNSDFPPKGSGKLTSLEFIEVLIQYGAKVNLQLTKKFNAFGARVNLEGATPLFMAAKTADIPFINILLKHGADPLLTNINNVTPLMMAAGLGTAAADEEAGTEQEAIQLINLLVSLGADVNAVSLTGETAMHGAAYKNFPLVIKHLDQLGANIELWNKKNKKGWTAMLIAQGFRPGNYKPSEKTEQAFKEVMLAKGLTPPKAPSRTQKKVYL